MRRKVCAAARVRRTEQGRPASLNDPRTFAAFRAALSVVVGRDRKEPATKAKRTFHSFRHTYGRVAMERGAELKWLQGQMGHATLAMTADRYGHFGEAARKREAAKLEGAFNF